MRRVLAQREIYMHNEKWVKHLPFVWRQSRSLTKIQLVLQVISNYDIIWCCACREGRRERERGTEFRFRVDWMYFGLLSMNIATSLIWISVVPDLALFLSFILILFYWLKCLSLRFQYANFECLFSWRIYFRFEFFVWPIFRMLEQRDSFYRMLDVGYWVLNVFIFQISLFRFRYLFNFQSSILLRFHLVLFSLD